MSEKMNEEKVKPKWYKRHQEDVDLFKELGTKQKGILISAMDTYAYEFVEPNFKNPLLKMVWPYIKRQIDFDYQKFINGKKGGRPKAGQEQATPVPYEDTQGTLPLNLDESITDEQAQKIINNAPFMQNPTGAPKSSLTETELQSLYQHAFFEEGIEKPFVAVDKFVHHNEANEWRDGKGKLIKNKLSWFKSWCASDKFNEKKLHPTQLKNIKKYWFPIYTVESNFFKEKNTLLIYRPKSIYVEDGDKSLKLYFDKTAYEFFIDKKKFWDYYYSTIPIEDISFELRE